MQLLMEAIKGMRFPGTGVRDDCEPSQWSEMGVLNLAPMEEPPILYQGAVFLAPEIWTLNCWTISSAPYILFQGLFICLLQSETVSQRVFS